MALAVPLGAGRHGQRVVLLETQFGGLREAAAAALDIVGEADTAQLAGRRRIRPPGLEAGPLGSRQTGVHRLFEAAAVVDVAERGRIGDLVGRDHVPPPHFVRRQAESAADHVDDPLHRIGRLRPAGAPVGADRHRVGRDALDAHVSRRNGVDPADHLAGADGRHHRPVGREVGAERGVGRHAHRLDPALGVDRRRHLRHVVAALHVGKEGFRPLRGPGDGAPELARGPGEDHVLGVDEGLHAETAADVVAQHPDLGRLQAEDVLAQTIANIVRALAAGPERQASVLGVDPGGRGARLHGGDHDAVVDQLDLDFVAGGGEGRLDGGAIAQFPVEHQVVLDMRPDSWRAGLRRAHGVDDGRQRLVIDLDQLGGVARLIQCLGDDGGDRVAHIAGNIRRQRRARRISARAAVTVDQRDLAGNSAQPFRHQVGAGQHRDHAGRGSRRLDIDAQNPRMCMGRTQHMATQRILRHRIVGEAAPARQQSRILDPRNTLPDPEFRHRPLSLPTDARRE